MSPLATRKFLTLVLTLAIAAGPPLAGTPALGQSATAGIRGVLLDAEGLPATGYQIGLRSASGDLFLTPPTAADGSFALAGLPPGRYELTAFDPKGEEFSLTRREVILEAGRFERVELRTSARPHPPGRGEASPSGTPAGTHRFPKEKLLKIGVPIAAGLLLVVALSGDGESKVSPSSP